MRICIYLCCRYSIGRKDDEVTTLMSREVGVKVEHKQTESAFCDCVRFCHRETNAWVQWAAHRVQHLILTLTAHQLTYIPLITHSSLMTVFTPPCKNHKYTHRRKLKPDQLCLCSESSEVMLSWWTKTWNQNISFVLQLAVLTYLKEWGVLHSEWKPKKLIFPAQ